MCGIAQEVVMKQQKAEKQKLVWHSRDAQKETAKFLCDNHEVRARLDFYFYIVQLY